MRALVVRCASISVFSGLIGCVVIGGAVLTSERAVAQANAWQTKTTRATRQPVAKKKKSFSWAKSLLGSAAVQGEFSVLSAAAAQQKDKKGPIPIVDDETLSLYPTAAQCGECHKQIYEEWSSSQHAYASISPMFHAFEQKFQELTQGTVGTFCVRCHQQVGTQLGEKRETPLWKRAQISREGVTCITCHRVKAQYGKVNGERRVEPGKIYEPVYGTGEKSATDSSSFANINKLIIILKFKAHCFSKFAWSIWSSISFPCWTASFLSSFLV